MGSPKLTAGPPQGPRIFLSHRRRRTVESPSNELPIPSVTTAAEARWPSRCGAARFRAGGYLRRSRQLGAATFPGGIAKPYLSRAADRPLITHGIQSGDVSIDSGVVWARADRPARMLVEVATTENFKRHPPRVGRCAAGKRFHREGAARRPAAGPGHFLSRPLRGPASPTISANRRSAASAPRRPIGARCPSSGPAIPPGRAGASTSRAAACAPTRPCCATARTSSSIRGDNIYADCPIPSRAEAAERRDLAQRRHRGEIQASPRRSPSYRGNYKYNLLDRNVRAFNAEVPIFAQWDDHEVTNDWWPGKTPRRLRRHQRTRCSRRAAAARSMNTCRCAQTRPSRAHLSQDLLRPAARRVHARHAELPRTERTARTQRTPAAISSARRRSHGSSASSRPRARPGR